MYEELRIGVVWTAIPFNNTNKWAIIEIITVVIIIIIIKLSGKHSTNSVIARRHENTCVPYIFPIQCPAAPYVVRFRNVAAMSNRRLIKNLCGPR